MGYYPTLMLHIQGPPAIAPHPPGGQFSPNNGHKPQPSFSKNRLSLGLNLSRTKQQQHIKFMPFPKQQDKLGEKAKRPHPGIPLNKETILTLIKKHKGNLSRIADSMGTTRVGLRNRINSDVEMKEALEEARERWIDDIEESVLSRANESNDTALQCFVLKTQAKHRGWEQSEAQNAAKDIATAAFDFIVNKTKNPAENGR